MTAGVKRSVRRALEVPLKNIITKSKVYLQDNATPAIWWPGVAFDVGALEALIAEGSPRYVRPVLSFGPRIVREWGNTPRIELSGSYRIGVYTPVAHGQDMNDTLAGIVESAYPYNADLDFGGIRVNIAAVDHGEAVEFGPWLYSPVNVNWNVWRS